MPTPTVLYPARAELAEGPTWLDGALWWVDIWVGTLNRLDPSTGLNTARATGDFLGAAQPATDGRWLLAQRASFARLDWASGQLEPLPAAVSSGHIAARHRFNDAKCDPAGRLWAGTMSVDLARDECGLFVLEPASPGSSGNAPSPAPLRRVRHPVSLANGLGWSPDGGTFYFADSLAGRIDVFPFDPAAGTLGEARLFARFEQGSPDGLTVDAEGHVWVALWGAGAVVRLHGRTGAELERIRFPVSQVSSCTFGGPGLRTLFVTSAWENLDRDARAREPLAGSIFAVETSTAGLPVARFGPRS